ncbi:lipopolysaccharide biosynthesis protein [Phycicoccus endophyticus]|uniref:Lipopolysaccharide biosynthesis protein n=1 Tax=Phycicoccus endophyticus TaxID=1690220 RepID=A0A7G9R2F4_9MICO|nr:lipopolysaccharide biosynthesis protein [Phycicoccus endophyticus]NHI20837.1 lipopolysaccharide biosynthesis protein [Phycicoccus endophyticus]QNN49779.1 lipopolysaccharide biosynthesis protein [Phycicoccus endophyticus]GGL35095.1 hypothetical protein GCM10012283_16870 [Phycicoccus endophyticus]
MADAATGLSAESQRSIGRLGRGSVANFGGAIVSAVANFGVAVLITRALPQTQAGVFFSVSSLFLLAVSVGQLGTPTGLVYFLSRARTLSQPELLRPYIRAARIPAMTAAFLAGAVVVVAAPWIAAWSTPGHVDLGTTFLRVLGVFIPFASLKTLNLSASRGLGTMRPTVLVEQVVRPVLQLVLVALVLAFHATPLLPAAWAVSFVVGAAGGRVLLSRRIEAAGPVVHEPRPVMGEFWRFTWPRAIANVAQTAMQRFDIVLVAALAGAGPAAVYAASTRFLVLGQLGNRAILTAAQPRLAEALARGVRRDVLDIYGLSTAWLMVATWPIYLLFATVGAPLLSVFGSGYAEGAGLLALLSLAMLVATGCGMVDMVINMAGRSSWNLGYVLLAAVTQFGLDVLLIPRLGVLGAAIGWASSIVTQNVFAVTLLGIRRRIHPFGLATGVVAGVAVLSFGVVPLVTRGLLGSGVATTVTGAALGSLAYGALLWRFRHTLHLRSLLVIRRRRPTRSGSATETGEQ